MIDTLYDKFKPWSEKGSVYIISDTHFEDADCKLMDSNWISPQEHIDIVKQTVHKNDTLIHLGDVGNPEWMAQIKAHKVLIMGNHDAGAINYGKSIIVSHDGNEKVVTYFDEIYTGPLFIAEKILLSHEPIINGSMWYNIHGHDHSGNDKWSYNHINVASNVFNFNVFNLGKAIKNGMLKDVDGIHRLTIDKAGNK